MTRRAAFGALLVVAVLVGAYLSAARRTEGPPLDPTSTASDGARGVVELLDRFADVSVVDGVPDDGVDAALLLEDRAGRDDAERLRRWVEDGGTLVVADPGSTSTPPVVGTVDGEVPVRCDVPGLEAVDTLAVDAGFLLEVPDGASACRPVGGGEGALVVAEEVGEGRIVAVGGPSPFTNELLDEADDAVLAVALLAPEPDARVAFLRPSLAVGSGDAGLVDLVGTPVWAALAQLGVAFLVVVLWRARRLGRPVPEPQPVLVESAELTEAVARLLARSRDPARAAAVLRDRARRQLSAPLGLGLDAPADLVVATLATRTSLSEDDARRAAVQPVTTDDELVAVAGLLHRLREEITHAARDRTIPRAGQPA